MKLYILMYKQFMVSFTMLIVSGFKVAEFIFYNNSLNIDRILILGYKHKKFQIYLNLTCKFAIANCIVC